jgi:hypothetical protein
MKRWVAAFKPPWPSFSLSVSNLVAPPPLPFLSLLASDGKRACSAARASIKECNGLEEVLKKPFKVRSAERDHETDKHRTAPILAAIEEALSDATKELEALRIRVRDALAWASFAAGTGSDEYLSREPEDNRRIAEYEEQLIAGENRIRQLEGQIANLIELRDLSSARFPELVN